MIEKKDPELGCFFCGRASSNPAMKMLILPRETSAKGICDSCVKVCIDRLFKLRAEEMKEAVNIKKDYKPEGVDAKS